MSEQVLEAGRPRRRILIVYAQPVFWSMGEGKGATMFSQLPAAIAERGHAVRVSLPARYDSSSGSGVPPPKEIYRGFELFRTPSRSSFVPDPACPLPRRLLRRLSCWSAYQKWGYRSAREAARGWDPDLILAMGFYEAPVGRRLARALHRPNVTRLFGLNLSLGGGRRLRFYANFPEILALKTPAERIILTDDGADTAEVVRRLRIPHERLWHARNGLDFDLFRPGPANGAVRARLGLRAEQPMLLTATRLAPEKKLDRAIDGLAGLLDLRKDAVLVLLGDGPERGRLKERVLHSGLEGRVLFPGSVPHHELPDWYRSADIVLSLLDRTNGSNPVFEAMACGRVVVGLDAGRTREVILHDQTGWVIAREELPRLGQILAFLMGEPELRKRLGTEAARLIPEFLVPLRKRMALEVDLLEEIIEKGRSRRKSAGGPRTGPSRVSG